MTFQRGGRAEREENGQLDYFHGLQVFNLILSQHWFLDADTDISDGLTVKP
jgi:hypothetical protein